MSLPALPATLAQALSAKGYDTLTPVQAAVSDAALAEADLLVSAQTGSGKTVGFGLAIARTLLGDDDNFGPAGSPLALVIAPTRELALQVKRELSWLYAPAGTLIASCVGGMDVRDERRALDRGAHIVVGTPGRLKDHILRGSLDLTSVRAAVLDEADEMLDLGFREDLEFILGSAPESRRTLMFSATVPKAIEKLAQDYQRDAKRISVAAAGGQHADISYQAMVVAPADAENAIVNVLRFHEAQNCIVFCNTRAAVQRLTTRLSNRAFQVVALSGELSQQERSHALQAMRDGRARVCVATDVAARGIDLPNLELVIHADLPTNGETLLHRSGRTGRAGRKGTSILIVSRNGRKKAENLLRFAKVSADWVDAPSADAVRARDEERLMADPVWNEEPTEREAEIAGRLLAFHGPKRIAAAYLRLYLGARSAPEELSGGAAAPRDMQAFGPSRWFSLSIGRRDRAEARWVLPMLCRAGNLGRSDVGAIRIQETETFVEVAEVAAKGLLKALGAKRELEGGIQLQSLASAPFGTRPAEDAGPAPAAPRGTPKPHRKGPSSHVAKADPRPADHLPADVAAAHGLRTAPSDDQGQKSGKPFKPGPKKAKYGKPAPTKGDAPRAGWAAKKPKVKGGSKDKPKAR
ncbi:MAG TPA: DEAD/DEAH box helicase [Paracoccaceae bacterium]|nr:DEAD/DEAH box helicase [Paracoccaceae bacterium]